MTLPNDDTPKPDDTPIDDAPINDTPINDKEGDVIEALETDDSSDTDENRIDDADIEYAAAEILPPIKVEPKKGLGFKSLLTATVFAGLLGAGGGFGLSYYLLPKLTLAQDTSALETRVSSLADNNQEFSTQIDRLEQTVRDVSRQAEAAGLTDMGGVDVSAIELRIGALEQTLETVPNSDLSEQFSLMERRMDTLTAFDGEGIEAVPVEIARRLEALETQEPMIATETADPATFMYGDRLLRDILQEILENQIALQSAVEATSEPSEEGGAAIIESDTSSREMETLETDSEISSAASTWPEDGSALNSTKAETDLDTPLTDSDTSDTKTEGSKSVIGSMTASSAKAGSATTPAVKNPDGTLDTGTPDYIKSRPNSTNADPVYSGTESNSQIVRPTIVLPEFPEEALRVALRDHELSGKGWFARVIGKNLSIKKSGERDIIDEITDLIDRKDIASAVDKMETLPSSVRSVGRDWMIVARQVR